MSLEVNLGKRRNILEVGPENASQVSYLRILWSILHQSFFNYIYPGTYCLGGRHVVTLFFFSFHIIR